jgi:hypothetical protein
MAYLYRHIRLDKNEPFYIGIGSDSAYKRAYETKSNRRNYIWNKITAKTDFEVEIMLDNLTWQEACIKEIEFISLYGRIDKHNGILSNLTDGGDGTVGVIISEKNRKLLSDKFSGSGNPMYGKKLSKESIEKSRQKRLGMTAWNKGKTGIYSEKHLKQMSESRLGQKAWNKGMKNVNGIGMAKMVIDLNTGIYYESARKASEAINMKHSTLKSKLNGSNKNNTSMRYV